MKDTYIDYTGMFIKCITTKLGNYTFDKLYPIEAKAIRCGDKKPTSFYIEDDERDNMYVEDLLKMKTKFIVVRDENSKLSKTIKMLRGNSNVNK